MREPIPRLGRLLNVPSLPAQFLPRPDRLIPLIDSLRADLAGTGWLAELMASADALVEDLGPGRLEAAELSPERLAGVNPRLAVLRISPFGQHLFLRRARSVTSRQF